MAEYVESEKQTCQNCYHYKCCSDFGFVLDPLHGGVICDTFVSTADVVPVVHGRWVEADEHTDDLYCHHKCSNCGEYATFDYKYSADWDEGMDGEWYFNGIIDDGINEHLTPYCPNCGARMDGE